MSSYRSYALSATQPAQSEMYGWRDLDAQPIHPIWREKAFRCANWSHKIALQKLDGHEYDFPSVAYQRMAPALRLASLFLRKVLPDLTRIRFGEVRDGVSPSGTIHDRVLSSTREITESEINQFGQELMRMREDYRIKICDYSGGVTACFVDLSNQPPYKPVFVQTAITHRLLACLSNFTWDASAHATNKEYLRLAILLVHELAHAVWLFRMLPLVQDEYRRSGTITVSDPEPRFVLSDGFCELGYAIELQLFGAIPFLPRLDDPTPAEEALERSHDKVLLTTVTTDGRACGVHQLADSSVHAIFNPQNWMPDEHGDILPTELSNPPSIAN